MGSMIRYLNLSAIPKSSNLALLLLRLGFGAYILYFHGLAKLLGWSDMFKSFPDPLGIGSPVSLGFTIAAELLMAALLVVGLFTRLAALSLAFTMGVAFVMVHGAKFSGDGSGELAFVYGIAFLVLFLAGAGKYSLDSKLGDTP